jgi:hypothetical protein
MLRPTVIAVSTEPIRKPLTLFVDEAERRQLDDYLQFLRYIAQLESASRSADTEAEN